MNSLKKSASKLFRNLGYIAIMVLLPYIMSSQSAQSSSVTGSITLPTFEKLIKKTKLYNADGSDIMQSDHPLAKMEQNVIVSVYNLTTEVELKPTAEAVVTQRQQTFIPHVLPVTKGTTVYLLNEDEFFHNIYSLTPGSRFNIGRRPPGNP